MTSRSFITVLALFSLAGCATEPPPVAVREEAPLPDTNVYFYPAAGRSISSEQQDRDKYECHTWAVQKTGFDPSQPNVPPHQRVRVVAGGPPPGADVAAGAGEEVVNAEHFGPAAQQLFAQMRADESGAASDQYSVAHCPALRISDEPEP